MNKAIVIVIAAGILLSGCTDTISHSKGIYMLVDTSGTYA